MASSSDTVTAAPDDAPANVQVPGGRIGRFAVEHVLGAGGIGIVLAGRDPELDRRVAIKILRAGGDGGGHIVREAQAMARVAHPNTVTVYEVGRAGDQLFIAMEYVDGISLRHWLAARARSWREIVAMFVGAGRGLAAMHAAGLVHRDFKPDNVMVRADGRPQVGDFGLATAGVAPDVDELAAAAPGASLSIHGEIVGTPRFMAPEQWRGESTDARCDQFAFAVALWTALFGASPFDGDGDALALRTAVLADRRRPRPRAAIPSAIVAALERGLAHDPAARWPDFGALLARFERVLGARRRRAVVGVVAAAVTATAVLAVGIAVGRPRAATPPTAPAPAVAPARWREQHLPSRGNALEIAVSPDGTQLAVLGQVTLMVVPFDGSPPRVLRRDLPDAEGLSWFPDGQALMVQIGVADHRWRFRGIDVATGELTADVSSDRPMVAPISATEWVATSIVLRDLAIHSVDHPITCALPGDYEWIRAIDVRGEAIYVTVQYAADQARALLVTDRTCSSVRVVVERTAASAFVPTRDGRVFAVVKTAEHNRLVEYDRSGARTGAPIELPAGHIVVGGVRPDGSLVLMRRTWPWRLVDLDRPDQQLVGGASSPIITLAPDHRRVAVITQWPGEPNHLQVGDIEHLDTLPPPIADGVAGVAWSPDGSRLATCSVNDGSTTLATIDPAGGAPAAVAAAEPSPACMLSWLDDHRLAYLRSDHRTYRWVDLLDGSTGMFPGLRFGWVFGLTVSGDGTAALYANGRAPDVWIFPSEGAPYPVHANPTMVPDPLWSADGHSLWIVDRLAQTIDRYDLRTRTLARAYTLALGADNDLAAVFPLADRLLAQTVRTVTDIFLYAPDVTPRAP